MNSLDHQILSHTVGLYCKDNSIEKEAAYDAIGFLNGPLPASFFIYFRLFNTVDSKQVNKY